MRQRRERKHRGKNTKARRKKEVALTFRSTTAFMFALDSGVWLGYVYVGNNTIIVAEEHLKTYEWLHPVVSEVVPVEVLPAEKQTTRQREHLIFAVGAAMKTRKT